jgi:hypothetical protein
MEYMYFLYIPENRDTEFKGLKEEIIISTSAISDITLSTSRIDNFQTKIGKKVIKIVFF